MSERIHSPQESDEYESVSYVAVPPRKRDFWKVLTGRYKPRVQREVHLTAKGVSRVLKKAFGTSEATTAMLDQPNPLFEQFAERDPA